MTYKYDLALSFAGEQRQLAERFANRLDSSGYSIFYDGFYQSDLWGQDLSTTLSSVYSAEARYCLIILSKEYLKKPWTSHERRSAISAFIHHRSEYILCLKVDDVELPGYSPVMAYLALDRIGEDAAYKLLLEKLGNPNHTKESSHLSAIDRELSKEIIEACFRRAIYTRMDSEIILSAMYKSIGASLGKLQQIAPKIKDQALQFSCNEIIRALDDIERVQMYGHVGVSNHLDSRLRNEIDRSKQRVVNLLLEVRRAADIPIQLPFALRTDHFFGVEQAEERPQIVA